MSKREKLASLVSITEPDDRWRVFELGNESTGVWRKVTLEDFHQRVSAMELNPAVPDDIYNQFLVARHLLLYSWYCYRFVVPAKLQGFATVEMALRKKCELEGVELPKRCGLSWLMKKAQSKQWLKNERFSVYQRALERANAPARILEKWTGKPQPQAAPPSDYVATLVNTLPKFRNSLAHGSGFLHESFFEVELCTEIINQLFQDN